MAWKSLIKKFQSLYCWKCNFATWHLYDFLLREILGTQKKGPFHFIINSFAAEIY